MCPATCVIRETVGQDLKEEWRVTTGCVWFAFSHQPSSPDSTLSVTCSLQRSQSVGLAAHDKDIEELCDQRTVCWWQLDVEHFAICDCVDSMHHESLHVWTESSSVWCVREPPCLLVLERSTEGLRSLQHPRAAVVLDDLLSPTPSLLSVMLLLSPPPEHELQFDGPALQRLGLH